MKYKIYHYDCWKDIDGTYYVNNRLETDFVIELDGTESDREIIKKLKDIGYLNKYSRYSSFEIDGEFEYSLYINYSTQKAFMPVCELKLEK